MRAQQHGEQPLGRHQAPEAAVGVDDREAGLAVVGRLPRRRLLVAPGGDHRRVRVHQVAGQPVRLGGQHLLQRDQPEQPVGGGAVALERADGDVGGRLVAAPDQ